MSATPEGVGDTRLVSGDRAADWPLAAPDDAAEDRRTLRVDPDLDEPGNPLNSPEIGGMWTSTSSRASALSKSLARATSMLRALPHSCRPVARPGVVRRRHKVPGAGEGGGVGAVLLIPSLDHQHPDVEHQGARQEDDETAREQDEDLAAPPGGQLLMTSLDSALIVIPGTGAGRGGRVAVSDRDVGLTTVAETRPGRGHDDAAAEQAERRVLDSLDDVRSGRVVTGQRRARPAASGRLGMKNWIRGRSRSGRLHVSRCSAIWK